MDQNSKRNWIRGKIDSNFEPSQDFRIKKVSQLGVLMHAYNDIESEFPTCDIGSFDGFFRVPRNKKILAEIWKLRLKIGRQKLKGALFLLTRLSILKSFKKFENDIWGSFCLIDPLEGWLLGSPICSRNSPFLF